MLNEQLGRRRLIGGSLALAFGATFAKGAFAAMPERRLAFRNVHTNETFDARFFGANGWDAQGLAEFNHGLRDWRNGEVTRMDPALLMLLSQVRDKLDLGVRTKVDLISGYRSPHTNEALRERGGEHTGVAAKSQHMLGKATDIHMPGIALDRLHMAAMSMQAGGVGYYPVDNFVHVDTGRVRHWG